ncbi:peptide/nickel transport system permease protein [Frankia sp. AiPs1]|uniref:ABC transporter permease n=1 Tax=Frankia sp. AiPa1 TaxID=573492 RepID=UPI00202AE8AD|nr:ABC transporter permease [Frankia sp. AiPa1]MCL9760515.1 ABC transporter permease [Frankia sp. AiPa1]
MTAFAMAREARRPRHPAGGVRPRRRGAGLHGLARRFVQVVFVVWAAFTGAFLALYRMPSDPVTLMLAQRSGGPNVVVDPAQEAALRVEYGFDQPLWRQYGTLLGRALRGDLGTSVQTGQPVRELLTDALPQTAQLTAAALLVAMPLGMAVPIASAHSRRRRIRGMLDALPAAGVSIPSFWLGILLLQALSFHWALLPATGNAGLRSLVLPAITLGLPAAAVIAQVLGRGLRSDLGSAYVELARARGASQSRIVFRHVLRNAALPALTVAGLLVANLFGGAVIVETVFARAGLGQVTVAAVTNEDLPVLLGLVVLAAMIYAVLSLLVEALYPLLDPRVRRDSGEVSRRTSGTRTQEAA